jgi:hypothetical protein
MPPRHRPRQSHRGKRARSLLARGAIVRRLDLARFALESQSGQCRLGSSGKAMMHAVCNSKLAAASMGTQGSQIASGLRNRADDSMVSLERILATSSKLMIERRRQRVALAAADS